MENKIAPCAAIFFGEGKNPCPTVDFPDTNDYNHCQYYPPHRMILPSLQQTEQTLNPLRQLEARFGEKRGTVGDWEYARCGLSRRQPGLC